jgi:hypothetical protein
MLHPGLQIQPIPRPQVHVAVPKVEHDAALRTDEDLVVRVGVPAVPVPGTVRPGVRDQPLVRETLFDVGLR